MLVVLRRLGDHDFRREQQAGNRGRVLQSQARDLGRSRMPSSIMSPYSLEAAL